MPKARTPHESEALQRQVAFTDGQIDELVYELYGLTKGEIGVVEGAANCWPSAEDLFCQGNEFSDSGIRQAIPSHVPAGKGKRETAWNHHRAGTLAPSSPGCLRRDGPHSRRKSRILWGVRGAIPGGPPPVLSRTLGAGEPAGVLLPAVRSDRTDLPACPRHTMPGPLPGHCGVSTSGAPMARHRGVRRRDAFNVAVQQGARPDGRSGRDDAEAAQGPAQGHDPADSS